MADIIIEGAKVHNLRDVDVRIPRNSLTVVTGSRATRSPS